MHDAYPLPAGVVFQDSRVFKAGNSLAIRIPSAIAKSIGLEDGSPVDMAVEAGTIWVKRAPARRLHELIDQISLENRHDEAFSEMVERERW